MAVVRSIETASQLKRAVWSKKNARRRWPSAAGSTGRTSLDHDPESDYMNQPAHPNVIPEHIDLREEVRVLIESDRRMTQAVVAREAGVSTSTFSQWLAGNYGGNVKAVEQKLFTWYQSWLQRQSASGLPTGPDWVETPSSTRIISCLRYAQLAADMVVIYGGAGVSKTKSVERYRRLAPNVYHATVTPASNGVAACLEIIAEAIGLRDFPRAGAALTRQIVQKLKGTSGLLIIDEAQHLSVLALDQVRSLHDATAVGVALVGNEQVYSRMTGGSRAAYLDRLFSRIGKRLYLKKATEDDIDTYAAAWGVKDRECRKQLHDIASRPGALRVLNKVLRMAASYAQAENRDLCCQDVRIAYTELGGE